MKKTTTRTATETRDADSVLAIRRLALEGEGQYLEFKRKVSQPEKIVRELIAFANSGGGTLLIGVDDNGTLAGVKYPDEELLSIDQCLEKNVRQSIVFHALAVEFMPAKFIVRLDIPPSDQRPVFFWTDEKVRETFVREKDMSIKASAQMIEIIRRKKSQKGVRFYFAEHELALMQYLDAHATITLSEFQRLTGLRPFAASRKLVLLVLANVLKITATEKGDLYARA